MNYTKQLLFLLLTIVISNTTHATQEEMPIEDTVPEKIVSEAPYRKKTISLFGVYSGAPLKVSLNGGWFYTLTEVPYAKHLYGPTVEFEAGLGGQKVNVGFYSATTYYGLRVSYSYIKSNHQPFGLEENADYAGYEFLFRMFYCNLRYGFYTQISGESEGEPFSTFSWGVGF